MADEIRHFTATIPAGTLKASPVTVAITMPPRVVRSIYWRVPNGPMGQFGWQLSSGRVIVFPVGSDQYILANDEHDTWYPVDTMDSGAWQVTGYNTGIYPHSVYLAFHVDLPSRPRGAPLGLSSFLLAPVPDLSQAGPPLRGQ